ncbi:MAG TPA: Calx-beta domain-containing protein [Pirellulaceae bacterium]|nr:Calx-beta domain-containing protein [Pirellulaceae bacterium]
MWFRSMVKALTRFPRRGTQRAANRKQQARRLLLESLEDRRVMAFAPAVSYPVGAYPDAVIAADFNNDGRPDLVTANNVGSNVSVLLSNADGTFQPAINSPTGSNPLSLAVGDFDGDGKLDLATANWSDVSVLKGNGSGGFAAPTNINPGSSPSSVAVGDFNSDGKLDLGVITNYYFPGGCGYYACYPGHYFGYANVLLGNGAGSFSLSSTHSLGYGYYTAAASADFNGDGKSDIAASDGYLIAVSLVSGSGVLGAPTYFGGGPNLSSFIAKDATGDGRVDLVTSNFYTNSVSVLAGNGAGSFAAAQSYPAGMQPTSVAVADFNGDSKPDLIAANREANTVSVLLGTASGTFKPPVNAATGPDSWSLAVGDFNGDGRADAATASNSSGQVFIHLNNAIWPALDAPSISIAFAAAVTEGNTGTVNSNFTVSLSAAYSQPVSVVYSTQDGSAMAGSDYQAVTAATLTFNPGETSKTISIAVFGDRIGEPTEAFSVVLTNPTNGFIANATGGGAILDDEPTVSIESYVVGNEGNTDTKAFTFTVSLSNEYDVPVTVDYTTADLTPDEQWNYGPGATAGTDYAYTSGTVTFPAHTTASQTITVMVNGDRDGESDELFFVNLSNPYGAKLGNWRAMGNIVNDEPYVWIDNYASKPEGNSGTSNLTFMLHLTNAYDLPVTVNYTTHDGSATAGSDYVAATGSVTIPANTTDAPLDIQIKGDTLVESDEYFSVELTSATNAGLSNNWSYGYILDDDTPPAIYIDDPSVVEGNSGTKLMVFTVYLSQVSGQTVKVNYATANGSAKTSDNDYVAKSGTLTFAPGETSKTISITINGDTRKEQNETLYVNLSGASGATIGDSRGTGTILNDDAGGKGNGKGNAKLSTAAAFDAALIDLLTPTSKKGGK